VHTYKIKNKIKQIKKYEKNWMPSIPISRNFEAK
jgi:hypothetical protein